MAKSHWSSKHWHRWHWDGRHWQSVPTDEGPDELTAVVQYYPVQTQDAAMGDVYERDTELVRELPEATELVRETTDVVALVTAYDAVANYTPEYAVEVAR